MRETCDVQVRLAHLDEAPAISAVILTSLRVSNANDYAPEIIERVSASFSPVALRDLMTTRTVLVACVGDRIVGTASFDGGFLRTMFVAPNLQRRGIGKRLVAAVEDVARSSGVNILALASSITAEPFYAKLGYRAVRDAFHGEERTIVMQRSF